MAAHKGKKQRVKIRRHREDIDRAGGALTVIQVHIPGNGFLRDHHSFLLRRAFGQRLRQQKLAPPRQLILNGNVLQDLHFIFMGPLNMIG